jgi:hypothetical protein
MIAGYKKRKAMPSLKYFTGWGAGYFLAESF